VEIVYSVIYLYPVSLVKKAKFISINKQAAEIYVEYGALSDETFEPVNIENVYGCMGIGQTVELLENETLMFSITSFHDKKHHDDVLKKVDEDPRINTLFNEMKETIELSRIVRGEFSRI